MRIPVSIKVNIILKWVSDNTCISADNTNKWRRLNKSLCKYILPELQDASSVSMLCGGGYNIHFCTCCNVQTQTLTLTHTNTHTNTHTLTQTHTDTHWWNHIFPMANQTWILPQKFADYKQTSWQLASTNFTKWVRN